MATVRQPDAFDGASQLMQAVLVDPLVNESDTLAGYNELLGDDATERRGRRPVPYIVIAPQDPQEIGAVTAGIHRDVMTACATCSRGAGLPRSGGSSTPGQNATHGDLLSYLFVTPELVDALPETGRRDARSWLEAAHDDGSWQLGRLPA